MPETPCLFENQTAVFLKCAEIDCALESAKKPRTAGLCGRTAGACDCGPLSCAKIERVNKGRKPPKRGMAGRENPSPKARFPIVGAGCTGPFHTSPTNAATFVSRGCGGYTRHPSPEPRTQRLTGRNTGGNEEPPHVGRLGCMESLWSGAVTPVFPPPFFQSSPAGSAFLPVSSPCCREPCALSCSQCAGMFQTDPIHYPVFPCR